MQIRLLNRPQRLTEHGDDLRPGETLPSQQFSSHLLNLTPELLYECACQCLQVTDVGIEHLVAAGVAREQVDRVFVINACVVSAHAAGVEFFLGSDARQVGNNVLFHSQPTTI